MKGLCELLVSVLWLLEWNVDVDLWLVSLLWLTLSISHLARLALKHYRRKPSNISSNKDIQKHETQDYSRLQMTQVHVSLEVRYRWLPLQWCWWLMTDCCPADETWDILAFWIRGGCRRAWNASQRQRSSTWLERKSWHFIFWLF